jgi:HD-GYP domain-containing protein (c-di-GMP phosphodiesterase class II)
MNQLEQTDENFFAKRYRLFIIAGGAFVAAWAIHQMLSLVLLSVTLFAAAQVIYLVWFRLSAKTRETEELSRLHFATAEALATAIDAKDQTTHCHVRRVQVYAAGLGEVLGLSLAEIGALKAGALLHDVGKLAVPAHIIKKPARLTPALF